MLESDHCLEDTEDDGADKGERDVRGHYAELTDERTKGHGNAPEVTSLAGHNAGT